MLEAEEPNKDFGSIEAWEYISTYLCGENDRKSCCHFLRGETKALARMGTFLNPGRKTGFQGTPFFTLQQLSKWLLTIILSLASLYTTAP